MESQAICATCSNTLPQNGFFCAKCLTQFKCRNCGALYEKEAAGCIICGTPKDQKNTSTAANSMGFNTFRLHETPTDRIIETTFSDNVGKELSGILRDAYSSKHRATQSNLLPSNTGNIESIIDEIQSPEILPDIQQDDNSFKKPQSSNGNNYPDLVAIAMKNLPSSETEWVVVYSFYASNFGKGMFKRSDIIKQYEVSKRKSNEKIRGLSACIRSATKAGYITPIGDEFSILDTGSEKAIEIINRTKSSVPKTAKKSSAKKNSGGEGEDEPANPRPKKGKKTAAPRKILKRITNLDFAPKGKESLAAFYKKFNPKSDLERNLLFVFYMAEILAITGITYDHIYTAYDALDLNIPENLKQTVINTKSKTGWIETSDSANITVTIKGRNQVKTWSKKD